MAINDRDLERMFALADIELVGASRAGLKTMLYEVMDEFISDSNCWSEQIPLTLSSNIQTYTLTPSQGGAILRLVAVIDQNCVGYPSFLQIGSGPPGAPSVNPPGALLQLVWPQNTTIPVTVIVIKKLTLPTQKHDVPDAPQWLLPIYERQILDGLLGRMMLQPNKSYSSKDGAQYHLKRFRDGIAVAKTAVMRSNLFGGQSWRFPRNFRTQSQRGSVSTPFPQPTAW